MPALSNAYWSELCAASFDGRTVPEFQRTLLAVGGTTVFIFSFTAFISLTNFFLYLRMSSDARARMDVWAYFGTFSLLSLVGCISGAVAWAFQSQNINCSFQAEKLQSLSLDYNISLSPQQLADVNALSSCAYRNNVGFVVAYGLEFYCLSLAKLLSLQRVVDFIFHIRPPNVSRARALVLGVVVVGNSIGMAALISAAVFSYGVLSQSFAAGATLANVPQTLFRAPDAPSTAAYKSQAIQSYNPPAPQQLTLIYAEATVLLTIVAVCTYVACLCIVHFENILRNIAKVVYARNSDDSQVQVQLVGAVCRSLRRRVLVTISVVFVTFLVRAVFSMMLATNATAVTAAGQRTCGLCTAGCHETSHYIYTWLFYTPEFQMTVVELSSPVALLVAFWGLAPRHMIRSMFRCCKCLFSKSTALPRQQNQLLPAKKISMPVITDNANGEETIGSSSGGLSPALAASAGSSAQDDV